MPTVAAIVAHLREFAPAELAASWDNVGLLLGDEAGPVRRVLTCLTVTPESAAEAIDAGAQLIVSHHPILFRPVQRLTTATAEGGMLWLLARAGIAVYSPHTALDNTRGGINDVLAGRLGLTDVAPLRRRPITAQHKLVVFVPDVDLQRVSEAVFAAGAGHIGQYSQCSFRLAGSGTFFGSDSTNPTVGQKGRREEVSEWRLEVVCPEHSLTEIIAAMRRAHSYEEPAFDVYPLKALPAAAGEGRVGKLPRPVSLRELAQSVQSALKAQAVPTAGDPARVVERVALACGAAGEFLADSVRVGADAFLTGEMRFHDVLMAKAQGIGVLLPGHYATERCGVEVLADRLQKAFPDAEVWASRRETDPLSWTI
jgi:dinuclear metal center YbgI/SA1388 family protein